MVEKILLGVCKQATEQRQEALEALEQGVPQLERCLVHSGTPLINEYYSKVLGQQGARTLGEALKSVRPGAGCKTWTQCNSTG